MRGRCILTGSRNRLCTFAVVALNSSYRGSLSAHCGNDAMARTALHNSPVAPCCCASTTLLPVPWQGRLEFETDGPGLELVRLIPRLRGVARHDNGASRQPIVALDQGRGGSRTFYEARRGRRANRGVARVLAPPRRPGVAPRPLRIYLKETPGRPRNAENRVGRGLEFDGAEGIRTLVRVSISKGFLDFIVLLRPTWSPRLNHVVQSVQRLCSLSSSDPKNRRNGRRPSWRESLL
jgi:hypothetical protein